MPTSVLTRQRSWIARIAALAMVASLMVVTAAPAGAAPIDTSASCPPASIPSAGFTDIAGFDATTQNAINCLAFYEITKGTTATTYSPSLAVARWQMALFLTRQAEVHGVTLPDGSPQGFTDIGAYPASTQIAINQIAQLGISIGTSATTFSPADNVTREQMALFLARLLGAVTTLPATPPDAGFTDIVGLPAPSQLAINQLAAVGVVAGTSATTYSPALETLRWQMALFLTRTLAADGITPPAATFTTAAPQLLRAERAAADATVVAFVFDQNVPGQALVPPFEGFRLYNSAGGWNNPVDASIVGNQVLARFSAAEVAAAARATARYGAVENAAGIPNIEGDAGLTPAAVATPAFPAQLKRVDNYRLSPNLIDGLQRILVDFTFDDDIADPAGTNAHNLPAIGAVSSGIFWLLGSNGQLYDSLRVVSSTVDAVNDDVTITIAMQASDPTIIPQSQLRRGIVFVSPGPDTQWLTHPWAASDGRTVDPDLVSVERTSATSYRFTFDEGVDDTVALLQPGDFFVADAAGNNTAATAVARSAVIADGATVVIATFPALPQSGAGTPVIGFVNFGAVTATDSTASINAGQNVFDEAVITVPAPTQAPAGVTALPDLVGVVTTQDIVTFNYTASFTFDSTVAAVASSVDFDLYDEDGTQFRVSLVPNALPAFASLSNAGRTVNITIGGYTNEQMIAAKVGAVQTSDPGLAVVTEGEVVVE
ncbi:MAG: S-layer homology domain-containing protein [Acidimicrobiia bacterium]